MEKQLPYLEQQHCIFHGIARIASINPHTLTPELRQVRDNMIKAMGLNAFMVDRGLKSSKNSQKRVIVKIAMNTVLPIDRRLK